MQFLAFASSVCKWLFVGVMVGVLDVKSLVEHNGEGLEVLKVYYFRDIFVFVMYYMYVTSGPSLLISFRLTMHRI